MTWRRPGYNYRDRKYFDIKININLRYLRCNFKIKFRHKKQSELEKYCF